MSILISTTCLQFSVFLFPLLTFCRNFSSLFSILFILFLNSAWRSCLVVYISFFSILFFAETTSVFCPHPFFHFLEGTVRWGYDAGSLGNRFQTFRSNLIVPSSRVWGPPLDPWRWRHQVPSKVLNRLPSDRASSQKNGVKDTTVKTSRLVFYILRFVSPCIIVQFK